MGVVYCGVALLRHVAALCVCVCVCVCIAGFAVVVQVDQCDCTVVRCCGVVCSVVARCSNK